MLGDVGMPREVQVLEDEDCRGSAERRRGKGNVEQKPNRRSVVVSGQKYCSDFLGQEWKKRGCDSSAVVEPIV